MLQDQSKAITTDADNPVNQSELVANTCSRVKRGKNRCEQLTIYFGFATDWLRKWRENF